MYKFISFFSGSSGNCYFVQTDNTKLLIDAGVSCKKIVDSLNSLNLTPDDLDGILISHEHLDHVKGLKILNKNYNIDIYADKKTMSCLEKHIDTNADNIKTFDVDDSFEIKDLNIHPFSIPHDAINPCGFNFKNSGVSFSVATDIGHMTKQILSNIEDSNYILLESNYDLNVLMSNNYPYHLKSRIKGMFGHLENTDAAKTIAYLSKNKLKGCMLGHLSQNSNMPSLAYMSVANEVSSSIEGSNFTIDVASRIENSKPFNLLEYK